MYLEEILVDKVLSKMLDDRIQSLECCRKEFGAG